MMTLIIFYFKSGRLSDWRKTLRRSARFVFSLTFQMNSGVKRASRIAIVFFGLVLYRFLVQQIALISIHVERTVVDADSLITDERSLFKSQRKIAWMASEREMFIAKDSPKNTFLYNLYYLKNEKPIRVLQNEMDVNTVRALHSNLFFLSTLTVALNQIAPISPNKFFINQAPLFSTSNVYYRKKERSPKMRYVDFYVTKIFEAGISEHLRERIKHTKVSDQKDFVVENRVFRSIEAYVQQNTFYKPINLYKFYYVFTIFLTIHALIILLFVTVRLSMQLKVWLALISGLIRIQSDRLLKMVQKTVQKLKGCFKFERPGSSESNQANE